MIIVLLHNENYIIDIMLQYNVNYNGKIHYNVM